MTNLLHNKTAVVTGGASGIGLASVQAMLHAGAKVVVVDRDEQALANLQQHHGEQFISIACDLLDTHQCAQLIPAILTKVNRIDIFHANAGLYLGGDLIDNSADAIDKMLHLNINVVMKNVHAVLPHMAAQGSGDIIVTSSLAAHFPTPWEPVYASSKWAIDCFVQTTRRQVFKQGIRMGAVSPGPVATALLADWPEEKVQEAKDNGSLIAPGDVADAIVYMLTRPRHITIRDMVIMPTQFDL